MPADRTILKFDDLPIAHFEAYVPLFSKHLWKLAISLKLWVPARVVKADFLKAVREAVA